MGNDGVSSRQIDSHPNEAENTRSGSCVVETATQ